MKKWLLGILALSFLLSCFYILVYGGSSSLIKEALFNAYLDSSRPCTYLKSALVKDGTHASDFDCLLGKSGTYKSHEKDIEAFVMERAKSDFPNHQFALSWSPDEEIDPWFGASPMPWMSQLPGVWICSEPAIHPLTTTTYALALCSTQRRGVNGNDDAWVKIYEIRPSFFGIVGRPIYERTVEPKPAAFTGVALRILFRFFNGHVAVTQQEHYLKQGIKFEVLSKVLIYRQARFEPFFEFPSFFDPVADPKCQSLPKYHCEAKARALGFVRGPLSDHDSVTIFEGTAPTVFEDWDGSKEIPFVFDSKNWTLKRKFPRKPDDDF